ncbi:hypothetical protein [Kamptonema formosum]|nr:hypothetical protein [Oscillatoria sp. PCC 10802]
MPSPGNQRQEQLSESSENFYLADKPEKILRFNAAVKFMLQ